MKYTYLYFLLIVISSYGNISCNEKMIEWSQGSIDSHTLELNSDSSTWSSNVIELSSPFVLHNTMPEKLSCHILEYDLNDSLLYRSRVWMKNDCEIIPIEKRRYRFIVKGSTPQTINAEMVSKYIKLKTGTAAEKEIQLRKEKFAEALTQVFTQENSYNHPLYMAHRGYTVDAPENSIPAFIRAGQKSAWAIETDLRFTKDSIVVCIHDKTIDRTYNGTGKISDYTYNELLEMKIVVGNNLGAYTDDQLRVPTLEQFLEICRNYNSVAFIELKEDASKEVIDAVSKIGMEGRYIISSSNIDILTHFRSLSDEMIHHINMNPTSSYLNELRIMGNASTSFNLFDPSGKDKKTIGKCHSMGLRVCFRAVDTAEYAKECIDAGLDFLPSNTMEAIKE